MRIANLQRITTEFIATEDRIRLAGEVSGEAAPASVALWLTLRLLNRLVPYLCEWLASGDKEAPIAELQQEFAQQKAQAELEPQAPVQVATQTQGNLVHSIDIQTSPGETVLTFKDKDEQILATMKLTLLQLRQWLSILYNQYRQAGWPNTAWPAWMETKRLDPGQCRVMVQ